MKFERKEAQQMDVKATLKEATSKNGKQYTYVSVMLTDTLEKKVFLEQAEIELLKLKEKEKNPFHK